MGRGGGNEGWGFWVWALWGMIPLFTFCLLGWLFVMHTHDCVLRHELDGTRILINRHA